SLLAVAGEGGRIGCPGFGGPPAHIALLRRLCVDRRGWLDAHEFEDAISACNLLPGPASTQLAIYCASRVRGRAGAIVGGLCFIVPGLILILALAALFLEGSPPDWIRGAGAGAGAAVAAVALQAACSLAPGQPAARGRWGALAALPRGRRHLGGDGRPVARHRPAGMRGDRAGDPPRGVGARPSAARRRRGQRRPALARVGCVQGGRALLR